jgi:hypothetical protein
MFCSSEVPEIDKLKDISVCIPVKRDLTLHPELEQKVENGKEQEEEDDVYHYLNQYTKI